MSRLCRLRNASHGDDGQWAYSEIVGLREQVEFWQKEAAGRRDDMANYTRIVSETIDRLNVEVSKLTKERDKAVRTLEIAGYTDSGGELWKPPLGPSASLPDLASPVLNRIRAEGMRMASTFISLVRNDLASAGDNLSVQAAEYLISAIDARAAELEKS